MHGELFDAKLCGLGMMLVFSVTICSGMLSRGLFSSAICIGSFQGSFCWNVRRPYAIAPNRTLALPALGKELVMKVGIGEKTRKSEGKTDYCRPTSVKR